MSIKDFCTQHQINSTHLKTNVPEDTNNKISALKNSLGTVSKSWREQATFVTALPFILIEESDILTDY